MNERERNPFEEISKIYRSLREEGLSKKYIRKRPAYVYYSQVLTLVEYLWSKVMELRKVAKWSKMISELSETFKDSPYVKLLTTVQNLRERAHIKLIRVLIDNIKRMLKNTKTDRELLQSIEQVENIIEKIELGELKSIHDIELIQHERELEKREVQLMETAFEVIELLRIAGLVVKTHDGYWCLLCNKRFGSEWNLIEHFVYEHDRLKDPKIRRKVLALLKGQENVDEEDVG